MNWLQLHFPRLVAPLLAVVLLVPFWLAAPNLERLGLRPVPPDQISLLAPGAMLIPMQPDSARRIGTLAEHQSWNPGEPRQYAFTVSAEQAQAVLVPALDQSSRLWINGIPLRQSAPRAWVGPGYGRAWLSSVIPHHYLKFDQNRADIVIPGGSVRRDLAAIYLGTVAQAEAAASAIESWDRLLSALAKLAAWVGIFAAMAGVALGHRVNHLGVLAISMALLTYAAGASDAAGWITQMPPAWPTTIALIGSLLFGWRQWRGGWLWVLLLGAAAVAAVFAALVGAWALLGLGSISLPLAAAAAGGLVVAPLLGGPLLLLSDGQRYFRALTEAKLEIAAQQVVIAEQKAALEEQIRVKAVVEERQRFVRDMHDGVGSHLFSLLMRVRGKKVELGEVEGEIQRGLDDLRLVADSLDNVGNDLDTALAAFRNRAKQQLDPIGITLKWNQPARLHGPVWDARQILSLYRLMQEAVSNAARHSGAGAVSIEMQAPRGSDLRIVIADDGCGFPANEVKGGKGLSNMRARAAALGGAMVIGSGPAGGTRIELDFPGLLET